MRPLPVMLTTNGKNIAVNDDNNIHTLHHMPVQFHMQHKKLKKINKFTKLNIPVRFHMIIAQHNLNHNVRQCPLHNLMYPIQNSRIFLYR